MDVYIYILFHDICMTSLVRMLRMRLAEVYCAYE